MKFIISVCIFVVVLARTSAEERNCEIEGLTDDDWSIGVNATEPLVDTDTAPKELFRAKQTGISFVETGLYLDAVLEAGHFVVRVSDRFRQYEEVETSTRFVETFKVLCGNEQHTLKFSQDVIDTNNHYPTFLTTEFTADLLLPTLWNADISRYLDFQIEVRDVDITNQGVIFTIEENDYVTISNGSSSADNKNHVAVLKTKSFLREVKQPLTLMITATDIPGSGNSRKSFAELSVTVDSHSVPATPAFRVPLYSGSYSPEDGITLRTIDIVQGYSEWAKFEISGDYSDLFRVVHKTGTRTIDIVLAPGTVIDESLYAKHVLVLEVKMHGAPEAGSGYTVVMITLPKPEPVPCPEILAAEKEKASGVVSMPKPVLWYHLSKPAKSS